MLTLTIDRTDPRYADPANRRGKARPRTAEMLGNPRAIVTEESTRYASWAWNRFRTYFVREFGPMPYFRGLELHKSGVAHLHVLIRVRDAVEFMAIQHHLNSSGLVVRAGFGPIAQIEMARSGGDVARYVTKADGGGTISHVRTTVTGSARVPGQRAAAYVSKLPDVLPRFTRRSAWSLPTGRAPWAPGWVKPTPLAGYTWRVARASTETVTAALLLSGDFHIADPDDLRVPSGPMGPESHRGIA